MSRRIARKLKRKKSQKKRNLLNTNDNHATNSVHKLTHKPIKTSTLLNNLQQKKGITDDVPYLDSSPKVNHSVSNSINSGDIAHSNSHHDLTENETMNDISREKTPTPESSVASSVESMVTPVSNSRLESTVLYNNNNRKGGYSDDDSLLTINNSIQNQSSKENSVEVSGNIRNIDLSSVSTNNIVDSFGNTFGRSHSISMERSDSETRNIQNKRRRSSASALSPATTLERTPKLRHEPSLSSIAVPKKKKKLLRPASLSLTNKAFEKKLSVKDLRDLVLYVLESKNNSPSWVHIDNKNNIQKVITLFVPGIQAKDICNTKNDDLLFSEVLNSIDKKSSVEPKFLDDSIKYDMGYVQAPGSKNSIYSSYNSFVNVGLTKEKKQQLKEEMNKNKITINDLLLNVTDLNEASYPIHPKTPNIPPSLVEKVKLRNANLQDAEQWVETQEFDHAPPHIFALDCEMCLSEKGHVLTRCSIVNFKNEVVYDRLVKPNVKIVDYLTKYSGITEEMLANVDYTQEQVQQDILKIISSDDILIGHSLQSDLNILKIRHTKIVDTAFIYEHKAGPPFRPSLKYLSQEYLNISIQNDDMKGHDSITDAQTCMDLTKLKIENGLAFGLGLNTESIFKKLSESSNIRSVVLTDYAPEFSYDGAANKDNCKNVKCTSDDQIIDEIIKNMDDYDFFVGRLRDLEFERGYSSRKTNDNLKCMEPSTGNDTTCMIELQKRLTKLYNSVPTSTLILLYTGSGDVTKYKEISTKLHKITIRENRQKQQALLQDELSLAVIQARDSMATFLVKA